MIGLLIALLTSEVGAVVSHNTCTITRLEGGSLILGHPSSSPTGPPPHYIYKGKFYSYRMAEIGDVLPIGNLLQTSKNGKVRLVFNYGDLIEVSNQSMLRVNQFQRGKRIMPSMDLVTGRLRVAIKENGVLSGMPFSSPLVNLEVNGAEFYIAVGKSGKTFLGVLRGAVLMRLKARKHQQPYVIQAKYAISVEPDGRVSRSSMLTRPQVLAIQSHTNISGLESFGLKKKQNSRLRELEGEAYDSMMENLMEHDPGVYQAFVSEQGRWRNIDSLLAFTIENLVYEVPMSHHRKPLKAPEDLPPLNKIYPSGEVD